MVVVICIYHNQLDFNIVFDIQVNKENKPEDDIERQDILGVVILVHL